jgi:hypothetical protein
VNFSTNRQRLALLVTLALLVGGVLVYAAESVSIWWHNQPIGIKGDLLVLGEPTFCDGTAADCDVTWDVGVAAWGYCSGDGTTWCDEDSDCTPSPGGTCTFQTTKITADVSEDALAPSLPWIYPDTNNTLRKIQDAYYPADSPSFEETWTTTTNTFATYIMGGEQRSVSSEVWGAKKNVLVTRGHYPSGGGTVTGIDLCTGGAPCATFIGDSLATSPDDLLTATGNTLGTALDLTAVKNRVTTVTDAAYGVSLPILTTGNWVYIINADADDTIHVWGNTASVNLNGAGAGTALHLAPDGVMVCLGISATVGRCAYLADQYGSISVNGNASGTTLTAQNTWYQFAYFDTDDAEQGADADHSNNHIVVRETGDYFVAVSASFSGSAVANQDYELEVQVNNGATQLTNLHLERRLSSSGDVGSGSISGIASLTVDDTVELWIQCTTSAGKTITIKDATLALHALH